MLAALIDEMHADAGVGRPRILSFPEGAEWGLNVRHDFDRAQSRKQVDAVLSMHADAGTAATWYWRSRHISGRNGLRTRVRSQGSNGAAVARRVAAAPRQEVALHTEQLWITTEEERRKIERAVRRPVVGSSAHGDPECFRWQGAPNVIWADRNGLDYTEFISHSHLTPHRFAMLGEDGTVEPARVVCLPHHESLDRSTTAGDAATESVLGAAETYVRAGGFMQILNHPDLNLGPLTEVLAELPSAGRIDWTAADCADWWRRTHVESELSIDEVEPGEYILASKRGVRGAVLEVLEPDGESRRFSIHIEAGDSVSVRSGERSVAVYSALSNDDRWRRKLAPAFVQAAKIYYDKRGLDPDAPGSRSTIAINSELVPGRVESMLRLLRGLGGPDSLSGKRVLDCGSGFGAFSAYLANMESASLVTGIDNRPEFTAVGNAIAEEAGLIGLDYRTADMRLLEGIDDAAFDLAVANNSLLYLTTPEQMEEAAASLARVVAPGGHLFIFQANRWRLREPFTHSPFVHLLPPSLAGRLSRMTGWEHSHGRVRLVSAPWLARMLGQHGFDEIATGASRGRKVIRSPRSYFAGYYSVVARRST